MRYRYWLMLLVASLAGIAFQLLNQPATASRSAAVASNIVRTPTPDSPSQSGAASPPAVPAVRVQLRVRRGDTLAGLFAANHLSAGDLDAIMRLGGDTERLKTILPGEEIDVGRDDQGHVLNLHMQIDEAHLLDVQRETQGFKASILDIPATIHTAYAHGVIENSLFDAANRAGLSDGVTMELIHLYA
ncbi:MAG TPA: LysM-like peptidoglycan-binding domain-containing protein, partial [Gammaproteobacteria bacterium]|nr:LysM-like peptidoglycan-binding domain-containing protein [Gammaproteobacteria bacterium]